MKFICKKIIISYIFKEFQKLRILETYETGEMEIKLDRQNKFPPKYLLVKKRYFKIGSTDYSMKKRNWVKYYLQEIHFQAYSYAQKYSTIIENIKI